MGAAFASTLERVTLLDGAIRDSDSVCMTFAAWYERDDVMDDLGLDPHQLVDFAFTLGQLMGYAEALGLTVQQLVAVVTDVAALLTQPRDRRAVEALRRSAQVLRRQQPE